MHRIWIGVILVMILGSCNQAGQKSGDDQVGNAEKIISATIEELFASPAEYKDKVIAVSGMVTHVCRHGGQKCFALGEDGETQIRIIPGGDIDEFKIDLEGSDVAFKGTFRVLNPPEAKAHVEDHDSKEHHATEMAHSEAEKAEFFIEAVDFKELNQ